MLVTCEHGQMPDYDGNLGNEEHCCESPTGKHEADPNTFHLEPDGDAVYVDVNCAHCGRGGYIGRFKAEEISW